MREIIEFYSHIYLNKGSKIAIILSFLLALIYEAFFYFTNIDSYYYNHTLLNENYLSTSLMILYLMIILVPYFIFIREANLLTDSFDTFIESYYERKYIFIFKQITILSISLILTLSYFLLLFGLPYFFFDLFKINFLNSILNTLLFEFIIIEIGLLFNYLFKNYFFTLIIGVGIFIINIINTKILSCFVPTMYLSNITICLKEEVYYYILYGLVALCINYFLYVRLDRK